MQVTLAPPIIDGDTVRFAWTESEPNPFWLGQAFAIRYEGIDLAVYADALFVEIWLAMAVRVYAALGRPVDIRLPQPLGEASVAYWLARRGAADRVAVGPTAPGSESVWRAREVRVGDRPFAISFGGGKDSLATLGLANELYGADPLLVLHVFAPFPKQPQASAAYARRMERYSLDPVVAATGVTVGRIFTDYRQLIPDERRDEVKPRFELYGMMALPMHLAYGAETVSISEPFLFGSSMPMPDGSVWVRGPGSRPQTFDHEWLHGRRALGVDLRMVLGGAVNNSLSATWLLLRRYPHLASTCMTCIRTTRPTQFCYACDPCAVFGLFVLAAGVTAPWYDVDAMFGNDNYWDARFAAATAPLDRRLATGNAPYADVMGNPGQAQEIAHALATLQGDVLARCGLGPAARARLDRLRDLWGNALFPQVLEIPRGVAGWVRHPYIDEALALVGEEFRVVDAFSGPMVRGDTPIRYDFDVAFVPSTADVPHLRRPMDAAEAAFVARGGRRWPMPLRPDGITPAG